MRLTLYRNVAALVSTHWLKNELATAPKNLRLLDSSWVALKSGQEDYLSAHIGGAQFFDLNHCVEPSPTVPRNIPDPTCFTKYAQSLGLSPDNHLVVYDRGGMLPACKTWWTFRAFGHQNISVVDGGFKKWQADGNEIASGEEKASQEGNFVAKINRPLIKTFVDIMDIVTNKSSQILDARTPEHFKGNGEEPSGATLKGLQGMGQPEPKVMRKGHIPGSLNLLEDFVFDPSTKLFLEVSQIKKVLEDAGVDLSQPLTTTCYTGNAAAVLAFATHLCGKKDTSVYFGSWTEYGQLAGDMSVVKGG